MSEKRLTFKKFKEEIKQNLEKREYKGLTFYYFKNLRNEYKVNEKIPINTFVYSAKDIARNDYIVYKIQELNEEQKIANVFSNDYGFASFYFDSLIIIPNEILKYKHHLDINNRD